MDTHNDINVITDTRSSKINAHITYTQQTLRIYGVRDLSGIYIVLYICIYLYVMLYCWWELSDSSRCYTGYQVILIVCSSESDEILHGGTSY